MATRIALSSSARGILAVGLVGLLSAGCLQIETLVDFHEDGSATITERMNFSRSLLNMAAAEDADLKLLPLLQRDAALQRMKAMGKGVELVAHKVQEGEQGSMESVAVFKTPDLNGFRYVSPWPTYADYPENNAIEWKLDPMYSNRPYGKRGTGAAGTLRAKIGFVGGRPKDEARNAPEPTLSPVDAQVFRELSPVFRDMLRDFQLSLTFRSYAPVFYAANLRDQPSLSRSVDLINVTDRNLDLDGNQFFENEEIMLNLVQWRLTAQEVARHLSGYQSNLTLPMITPFGSRHMWHIGVGVDGHSVYLPPSKPLFDRYFKGKTLDYSSGHYRPGGVKNFKDVPATWERIGFVPVGNTP